MRRKIAIAFLSALGGTAGLARAQGVSIGADVRWKARLEQLTPADPEGYLRLGEEIADRSDDQGAITLARRLYVLAFELDRADGTPTRLAASACLALADLTSLERDQRWLRALADLVRPRTEDAPPTTEQVIDPETGYRAATLLGMVRAGDGVGARQLLRDPRIIGLLTRYQRLLLSGGGSLWTLQRTAELWPCPECGNKRAVRRTQTNPPEYALCPRCNGNPGPRQTEQSLIAQLRFEARLLSGIQRSWGAQLAADLGEPLRDPTVTELAPTYDVDPKLSVYRDGRWTAPASTAAPPSGQSSPP